MKGETSIVYHARFEAKVSPKLNCLDEHEARGLWIQIVDCYRPRPSPLPPTLIPRVFSIKLRDPAVPLTKLTIHKLTFLNNELNYIQSNRSPFFAPINGHFSFIIPPTRRFPLSSRNTSLCPFETPLQLPARINWTSRNERRNDRVLFTTFLFQFYLLSFHWHSGVGASIVQSIVRSTSRFDIHWIRNKLNSNYRKNDC